MLSQACPSPLTPQNSGVLTSLRSREVLADEPQTVSNFTVNQPKLNLTAAQERICNFFLDLVKQESSETVLLEFKRLFIEANPATDSSLRKALNEIINTHQQPVFNSALKRSIYILVNNWILTRKYKEIHALIDLLFESAKPQGFISHSLRRLHGWLRNFVNSNDYQELKIFVAKYNELDKRHWSDRYSSYLLVSQAVDLEKPIEQREAARIRSEQLKEQFKYELAMYTARSQSKLAQENQAKNPTVLGDHVLRLITKIVVKRGAFSYANLANIFLQQTQNISYKEFKQSLIKYLVFSVENQGLAEVIKTQLSEKLETLYESHHEEEWNRHLLLRTCNRVIEYLTTEDQKNPSPLFTSLTTEGNSFTLVIMLLKIILICKQAYTHLECSIAYLIQHYTQADETDCEWLIRFLEILKVTLTIYADNVQYSLVSMESGRKKGDSAQDLRQYRVFSQMRREAQAEECMA